MMNPSFWKMFWRSAGKAYGAPLTILSGLLALLLWRFPPTTQVPLGIVIVTSMLGTAVLLTLAHMAYSAIQELQGRLPRVIHSRKGEGAAESCPAICLLEQSELFNPGVAVAFYFKGADDFEVLIGIGRVLNVQDDRRIQVGLNQVVKGQKAIVKELRKNNADILRQLIVKPSVPAIAINSEDGGEFDD